MLYLFERYIHHTMADSIIAVDPVYWVTEFDGNITVINTYMDAVRLDINTWCIFLMGGHRCGDKDHVI